MRRSRMSASGSSGRVPRPLPAAPSSSRTRAGWRALLATLLALAVVPALARAAGEGRVFVPVQAGFQAKGEVLPDHVPGRLVFQLAASAQEKSSVQRTQLKYGQLAPNAATGLAAVDRVLGAANAKALTPGFIEAKNAAEATRLGMDRWYVVDLADAKAEGQAFTDLAKLPEVEAVTYDWIAFPAVVPADPLYSIHWGHNNTAQMLSYNWTNNNHETGSPVGTVGFDTNAQVAWDGAQGFGSSSVLIAIIDSGVQAGHPDLLQVAGFDFGNNDSNPNDDSSSPGHGTACAGVAASLRNSLGSVGIAAGCSIMPLKVANSAGSMSFTAIQNALTWAADHGANVISMSLGAAISSDAATDAAILYAYNAGCTILAATGNENNSTISYPAINANVIGVGAASPCGDRKRSSSLSSELNPGVFADPRGYTCDGERWWGSNYGVATQDAGGAVDVIAPTILPTTDLLGAAGYDASDYSKWFNGTSCATPYAAGVCALIKSANPTFTPAQVRAKLTSTAQDVVNAESGAGWDRYAGYGMVDAAAAVAGGTPPADAVTVTAPNGGETWTIGSARTITWTWTGSFTTVNLDYSTNAGTSWTNIATGASNTGSYAWTVPNAATTQARVRVSGGTATDQSNANFTIASASGNYATLPYTTGFEGGAFDAYWTTAVTANGRVRLATTNTPHAGSYHMLMDDATSGGYSQTEAWLRLNLTGVTQADLSFWWKDFGDETQTQDGIYFSNNGGTTFTKVYSLAPASFSDNTWRQVTLDLDALAATAGLSLTSTFVVKFEQYDDYPIATDGMAFDDISVTVPASLPPGISAESEPNDASTTADGPVGTGRAVTGAVGSTTDNDWYYFDVSTAGNVNVSVAIGTTADLDWFLYNSALTEVARGFSTANPEVGSYTAAAGRYYLKVNGYSGATSSYTLTVSGGLANANIPRQKDEMTLRPLATSLAQNAPNPFRGGTAIAFTLAQRGRVNVQVLDAAGRVVATLADGELEAGPHQLQWSARDARGHAMPVGVYFYRMTAPGFAQTRKMVVLE